MDDIWGKIIFCIYIYSQKEWREKEKKRKEKVCQHIYKYMFKHQLKQGFMRGGVATNRKAILTN